MYLYFLFNFAVFSYDFFVSVALDEKKNNERNSSLAQNFSFLIILPINERNKAFINIQTDHHLKDSNVHVTITYQIQKRI